MTIFPTFLIKLLNMGITGSIILFVLLRWLLPAIRSGLHSMLIKRTTYAQTIVTLEQEKEALLKIMEAQNIEYEILKNKLALWRKGREVEEDIKQQNTAYLEKKLQNQEEKKNHLYAQNMLHTKALSHALVQATEQLQHSFKDEQKGQNYIKKIIQSHSLAKDFS
jgi:hypothetical protein